MTNPIQVWEFYNAPENYRKLSDNGGDEDGIVLVPTGVEEPWWLERLWSHYGDPQKVELPEGTVYIWAH